MIYLIITSLIWAFSFSLVKENLNDLHPMFVAFCRLLVALPVFLPFLKPSLISRTLMWRLLLIGGFQYGILYSTYTVSFQYLDAYEVALFTILTPIYVIAVDNLYKRQMNWVNVGMALLSVVGAAVIKYHEMPLEDLMTGFLLVQASNICFAVGQIEYRRLRQKYTDFKDREVYAVMFAGAVAVAAIATTAYGGWGSVHILTQTHVWTLLFLGTLATGVGFFLWNVGATKTHAGLLSVFNNLKIPLAILVTLIFFSEQTDIVRLMIGGGIMIIAAVIAERAHARQKERVLYK